MNLIYKKRRCYFGFISFGYPHEIRIVPKLSAAIATPPLNLTATTEVPVTAGDWVWVLGPVL